MDIFRKRTSDMGPLGNTAYRYHGYFTFPKLEGEIGNRMFFNGKEKIVWSLNNYLGLANHPEVRKVDAEAAERYGIAHPMGARMMSGNNVLIEELESRLAAYENKEAAMLLNYGYQGVFSIIDALTDRHDIIIYDAQSHACIIDGIRLHQGKRFVFKHNDPDDLETKLIRATSALDPEQGGILVITEGVFGMAGDQGKLSEIVALKERYDFRLFVDDAHGFGTMGENGAGTGEEQIVSDGIDLYFSTFAKAMASIGAFVAGDRDVIDYLYYNNRSQIFAKTLPTPIVSGLLKRLDLLQNEPGLRDRLWDNVHKLQKGLRHKGFDLGNSNTPVTPVYLKGSYNEAIHLAYDLRETYDIFCSIVIYPVVPQGTIILRMIPTAVHTDEDIEITLNAFGNIAERLFQGKYEQKENNLPIEKLNS